MAGRRGFRVPVLLGVEVVLLGAAAVLWGLGLVTSYGERLGLLALVAVAMGVQGRVRVTPTNYFTGTLTSLAGRLALRELRAGGRLGAGRLAASGGGGGRGAGRRWWSPGAALGAVMMAAGALALETVPGRGGRFRRDRGSPGRIGGIQPGRLECGREGRSPLGGGLHGASALPIVPMGYR